jgi:hypothetical protein
MDSRETADILYLLLTDRCRDKTRTHASEIKNEKEKCQEQRDCREAADMLYLPADMLVMLYLAYLQIWRGFEMQRCL